MARQVEADRLQLFVQLLRQGPRGHLGQARPGRVGLLAAEQIVLRGRPLGRGALAVSDEKVCRRKDLGPILLDGIERAGPHQILQ